MINPCPNNPDVYMLRNFHYVTNLYIDILERVISKKSSKKISNWETWFFIHFICRVCIYPKCNISNKNISIKSRLYVGSYCMPNWLQIVAFEIMKECLCEFSFWIWLSNWFLDMLIWLVESFFNLKAHLISSGELNILELGSLYLICNYSNIKAGL